MVSKDFSLHFLSMFENAKVYQYTDVLTFVIHAHNDGLKYLLFTSNLITYIQSPSDGISRGLHTIACALSH